MRERFVDENRNSGFSLSLDRIISSCENSMSPPYVSLFNLWPEVRIKFIVSETAVDQRGIQSSRSLSYFNLCKGLKKNLERTIATYPMFPTKVLHHLLQ